MVPAAFRSPGLVFSSVPYVQVFPAGCSRLVVPGWLFPAGCSCSAPVVSARLPAIPARLRLFPPGFGCPSSTSVVPPRLCCPRPASVVPVRLSELPAAAVCRKKAECLCRSVFFHIFKGVFSCRRRPADFCAPMKTKRRKILLLCMQVLLPVVPGLWTVLFRPETAALSPRMLVTWMLCLNLLFILIYWRRLGWSQRAAGHGPAAGAVLLLSAARPLAARRYA